MDYTPKPEHKFTFGLWTVGQIGRDPFGEPVRQTISPVELVHLLAEVGAYGVNFHDNDLVPIDATPAERDRIVREFKAALQETGLVVPMATTNLFTDPAFKDGAFTANDPKVRAYAIQKTMHAIDLGVECGAQMYVFWGGREGVETDAAKNPAESTKRFREALNFLHGVAQAWDAGKLFHTDLSDQAPGRYDQDFRFGMVNPKVAFFLVKFLEDVGYDGNRHFDAHAFRTENYEGVKDFARGCMRTYLILREKARQWNEDSEIQALLAEIHAGDQQPLGYSAATAQDLKARE